MAEKMKAVVAYAPHDYRLEEVDLPEVLDHEVLVKVEACGICTGDIKAYNGAPSFWGRAGTLPYIKAPMIPGHEFFGRVVKVGKGKEEFREGDRVIADQIVPCWKCRYCLTGNYYMCEKHDVFGFQNNVNGGMAEYIKFPKEAIIHRIPDHLSLESSVLVEPFACSKHCVDRSQIGYEDVVVLSGSGCLGLGMVGAIKLKSPKKLVVLDLHDKRLAMAKKFGADVVMNPEKENVKDYILSITDGYGCDVYIEATGHPPSVQQGLEIIRKMGRFVEFSVFKDLVSADWSIISDRKELNLFGAHLSPYCYPTVIEWIESGRMPTEGIVTHILPLCDWKEGFELAAKRSRDSLHDLLEWEKNPNQKEKPIEPIKVVLKP